MKVYRFPAFKGGFIFATMDKGNWWRPTADDLKSVCNLATQNKLSADELCKIPYVQAIEFEEIKDDREYVFLLYRNDPDFNDKDLESWIGVFQELAQMPHDEYKFIICGPNTELKRMKKNLLVFM